MNFYVFLYIHNFSMFQNYHHLECLNRFNYWLLGCWEAMRKIGQLRTFNSYLKAGRTTVARVAIVWKE